MSGGSRSVGEAARLRVKGQLCGVLIKTLLAVALAVLVLSAGLVPSGPSWCSRRARRPSRSSGTARAAGSGEQGAGPQGSGEHGAGPQGPRHALIARSHEVRTPANQLAPAGGVVAAAGRVQQLVARGARDPHSGSYALEEEVRYLIARR